MSVVADLGDSNNPLGFLFWYQFAGFATALSLAFTALMYIFRYLASLNERLTINSLIMI